MPKPGPQPKQPDLEDLVQQLGELRHDMATCGFNSYGVKRDTYFAWLNRAEQIHKDLSALVRPAPPVPAKV